MEHKKINADDVITVVVDAHSSDQHLAQPSFGVIRMNQDDLRSTARASTACETNGFVCATLEKAPLVEWWPTSVLDEVPLDGLQEYSVGSNGFVFCQEHGKYVNLIFNASRFDIARVSKANKIGAAYLVVNKGAADGVMSELPINCDNGGVQTPFLIAVAHHDATITFSLQEGDAPVKRGLDEGQLIEAKEQALIRLAAELFSSGKVICHNGDGGYVVLTARGF
jgi:hypothetical protein